MSETKKTIQIQKYITKTPDWEQIEIRAYSLPTPQDIADGKPIIMEALPDLEPGSSSKIFRVPPASAEEVENYINTLKKSHNVANVSSQVQADISNAFDKAAGQNEDDRWAASASSRKKEENPTPDRKIVPGSSQSMRDIKNPRTAQNSDPSYYDTLKSGKPRENDGGLQDHGLSLREMNTVMTLSEAEQLKYSGIAGRKKVASPGATLIEMDDDTILKGEHNHQIVFTRDRSDLTKIYDGYGSTGDPRASAIDIVVGRFPEKYRIITDPVTNKPKQKENVTLVDFKNESARIYISQKADVDRYFMPPNFYKTIPKAERSIARSAIAIKADDVRIISRRGPLRITTEGAGSNNSIQGKNDFTYGVHLVAGTAMQGNKTLQPMVKGRNLVQALKKIIRMLRDIHACVSNMWQNQGALNLELLTHYHISPFFGAPTTPATNLPNMLKHVVSLFSETGSNLILSRVGVEKDLMPYVQDASPKFICSAHHKLN